tara:strand:- start:34 stop:1029 length:996 start_codon:yes stop_codon:yes gene_type:complete
MTVDNIYYNANFENLTPFGGPAEFNQNRTVDILQNPSNYYSTVEQFSLPLYNIPLIPWINDFSWVGLRFGAMTTRCPVNFIPNSSGAIGFSNPIYQYQHLIRMVNKALMECFIELQNIAVLPITITQPPRITYDPPSQLCSIYTQIEYDGLIDVIMDNPTFSFFGNFANLQTPIVGFPEPPRILLIPARPGNIETVNAIQYIKITQDYVYIQEWSQFDRLIIETASLPINPQEIGASANIERTVLTDFLITKKVNNRLNYTFTPTGPLNLQTISSEYPLRRIQMQLTWFNALDLTTKNVVINNTGSASVKLTFTQRLNQILLGLDDIALDS